MYQEVVIDLKRFLCEIGNMTVLIDFETGFLIVPSRKYIIPFIITISYTNQIHHFLVQIDFKQFFPHREKIQSKYYCILTFFSKQYTCW